MDTLSALTKDELIDLFHQINNRYLSVTSHQVSAFINEAEFLKVRAELRDVLNELQSRRENSMTA